MIDAKRIEEIILDSLYNRSELEGKTSPPADCVFGEGIVTVKYGFHPVRLESHRNEIVEILKELPDQFRKDKGGGWSFLQMCFDKNDTQWGEHKDAEALIALGTALGIITFTLPRKLWDTLPGSVPYITIDLERRINNVNT